jgi:neutral amino acid transport system permease protein
LPYLEVGLILPKRKLGRGLAFIFATLALAATALSVSAPASAASLAASKAHSSAVVLTGDSSDPSTWEYSIGGALKLNGKPVKGVNIVATNGKFSAMSVSDEGGKWLIAVPDAAIYKVSIDKASLPSGMAVANPEMEADLTAFSFAPVLFKFAGQTVQTVSLGDQLVGRLFSGLNFGLLLAIASIGISLIFGTTGLSNFAHGEMVTLGALMMWLLHASLGWPVILAGIVAVLVTGAFGWVQDAALWRPLRKRRMGLNQMMIVSIGFSIVVRYVYLLLFDGDTKDIAGGGNVIKFGPVSTTDLTLWGMLISVIALGGVALFLTRTRIGKATRAVSDNAALASATGIDVERIIRIVWVTAAALTGIAGVLYGLELQANWLTGFDILLLLFASVTLGGLGTALGATVGALIIGMVVEVSSLFIPNELRYAAALVILIVILIWRPQGVLGKKQRLG